MAWAAASSSPGTLIDRFAVGNKAAYAKHSGSVAGARAALLPWLRIGGIGGSRARTVVRAAVPHLLLLRR